MLRKKWILATIGLILAGATIGRADDYIQIAAQSTSGPPVAVNVGGSSLIDLAKNIVDRSKEFEAFQGLDFNASLKYGGVNNVMSLAVNDSATSATLSFPLTGFTKTFTGDSEEDVRKQIEDFLKKDGAGVYADLLKAINEKSPVSVLDGNPQAATAFLSRSAFKQYGFHSPIPLSPSSDDNDNSFTLEFSGGNITTPDIDGSYLEGRLQSAWRFGDHVGLSLAVPMQYRTYGGSAVYTIGLEAGLPITLVNDTQGIGWQITPFATSAVTASVDLVAGGVLVGGGITNRLSWRIGQFTLAMANQFAYLQGQNITYGDYRFETHVKQPILTNGGQVTWTPSDSFFVDAGISYTNFLDDAAVSNYWSPTAGVGLRFGQDHASFVRVGYQGDFGDDYTSHGGVVQLTFNY